MRPIARQSTRLTSSSRVRQRSRPPNLPQLHVRSFSKSVNHRADANGSKDPATHITPVEVAREGRREREDTDTAVEREQDAVEDRPEDELKLAGSKTRRQRRKDALTPEIPKPPPVPEWFLRHNVKLQADTLKPNLAAKRAQVLRCVDQETGHTLFTVPYYEAWPIPETTFPYNEASESRKGSSNKTSFKQSFFNHKYDSAGPKPDAKFKSDTSFTLAAEEFHEDVSPHSLLRFALLEAEASILAGLTASGGALHASLMAASRVDVSLQCSDGNAHAPMDELVEDLATILQADLLRFDANDFEDLLAEYVGQGSDSPGSFSNLAYDVFAGQVSDSVKSPLRVEEEEEDEEVDEETDEDEDDDRSIGNFLKNTSVKPLFLRLQLPGPRQEAFRKSGFTPEKLISMSMGMRSREDPQDTQQYDDARLRALLDSLLDANVSKRLAKSSSLETSSWRRLTHDLMKLRASSEVTPKDSSSDALFRFYRSSAGYWYPDVARLLVRQLACNATNSACSLEPQAKTTAYSEPAASNELPRTIVHVRDLKHISGSRMGESIIRALIRVVQKRRRTGHQIIIVGTTARSAADSVFVSAESDFSDREFRTITIPPCFATSKEDLAHFEPEDLGLVAPSDNASVSARMLASSPAPDNRVLEVNLRHIQSMLNRLRPSDALDLFSDRSLNHLKIEGWPVLGEKVLTFDEIQRIALTATGLAQSHALSKVVNASHVALAVFLTSKADFVEAELRQHMNRKVSRDAMKAARERQEEEIPPKDQTQKRIARIRKSCNQHESRLLPGVVDAQNIKTGFNEVHAPRETINALKTMTSMSLLRPDAFKYGVLAADRLPGLMLYGPPGTGKTLLAKAVAKESRATVLEISGAQIYEKYVGEGEKMVKAVFSLAKKLSPCVVFIDEADAIFGSRSNEGNRNTHREIINQFLREWDGMDSHNVFIMVASNRPFDMDDAVLRRLPRRLLVDLPVAQDRESILKIHLKDEALDESIKLDEIARDTPLYSGSDLKNLCVAAALACVHEENELAHNNSNNEDFRLPEKRTLSARHFEKALKEISASISEDMSSLTGIRKFDEQYGDRRGRKKKAPYGFGMGADGAIDENSVRVRQSSDPSLP